MTSEIVVYCSDLSGFISYVKNQRNVSHCSLKFGIDTGGGFLKICLSIQKPLQKAGKVPPSRIKYGDPFHNSSEDSSVKRLFVLAISTCPQENYENVSELWELLNLNDFQGTIASDLKLINILLGIMSASASYPCPWGFSPESSLESLGRERLIEDCVEYRRQWAESGSDRKNAKNFFNCIHPPILKISPGKSILDIISPLELHLLLGVVNTIVNRMFELFKKETEQWIRQCNVQGEFLYGSGTGFKGNSCKSLLRKIDYLRAIANRSEQSSACLLFVDALQNFNNVVDDCFGNQLKKDFETPIEKFKNSYLLLNISVTPKVHAVLYHVKEFCKNYGLGFFCEQAIESVHCDYKKIWANYKVFKEHEDYANELLKSVVRVITSSFSFKI